MLSIAQKQNTIDSLIVELKIAKDDTTRVNILNDLGNEYLNNNPELAIDYLKKSLELAEKLNFESGVAFANNNIGLYYYFKGIHKTALEYFHKALKYIEEHGKEEVKSNIYNSIGASYNFQGNYANALEFYLKSLKIEERLNNKIGMARVYNNIGIIYYYNNNFEKTLEFFKKSLNIRLELGDSSSIMGSYNNIGEVHREKKNFNRALDYFTKSLEMAEHLADKRGIAQAYGNIGNVYQDLNDFEKTREYYFKAYEINLALDDKNAIAQALYYIGTAYAKEQDFKNAVDYFMQALKIAKEISALEHIKNIYQNLSEIYEASNNNDEALKYYKLFTNYKDSISSQMNSESYAELRIRFETEQKEKENELLKIENEITESKVKQGIYIRNIMISGFVVIVFFILLILRSFYQNKKINKQLSTQTHQILEQSVKLELANLELEKLSIVAKETSNAVVIIDKNGDIEWLNAGFSNIYGYSHDEFTTIKGKNILRISSNPNIKEILDECLLNKKSVSYESPTGTKYGTELWIQTTLTPIFDSVGNLRKIIAVDTDITAIKNAENEIKLKNKNITDSINYAKKIQDAILPKENELEFIFKNSFVFYLPKDIVSGDFYWFSQVNDEIIIAVADCTGHGVPGALMSMIGSMLLNEAVNHFKTTSPSAIINKLHLGVLKTLQQEKDSVAQDGMDISICNINLKAKKITYAGAMLPIYIVRDGDIETHEPNLLSVGGTLIRSDERYEKDFIDREIDIIPNMELYMFSDGCMDQFGGENNSKLNSSRFKNILFDASKSENCHIQKEILESTIMSWKGKNKQIDDMLVIGIKF
ncbi:MAG: hypothetical protein A2W98_12680 [Bacteroidetes bacterium GWF2_33_38]|nr:MAG: hypothetical protein A2W98_12680 [Bacteroidetes bacterium GWF2_33_38]